VRTEDDLRAALTALERHAPHPAAVLSATRCRRSSHRLGSLKASSWLAGITTAAALAGVITALTLPGSTAPIGPNGGVASPSGPTAPASLRAKLLAAFSATSGELVYERSTFVAGTSTTTENWYYPWQANPGQQVRSRQLVLNSNGTPYQDVEDIYTMPAPGMVPAGLPMAVKKKLKAAHLSTVVAAIGQIIDVEYGNRTWSDQKHHALLESDPASPQAILAEIKNGQWAYLGTTTVDGHKAIELDWKDTYATSYLWVDAGTYLPLRELDTILVGGPGKMITTVDRTVYTMLPATPANMALLTVPIPRGFTRTATQVLPDTGPGLG
jgi:hypothetical protein